MTKEQFLIALRSEGFAIREYPYQGGLDTREIFTERFFLHKGTISEYFNDKANYKDLAHLVNGGSQIILPFIQSKKEMLNYSTIKLTGVCFSFLEKMECLQELYLEGCKINDVSSLKNLKRLRILSLTDNNAINDISALFNLKNLEHLYLTRNFVDGKFSIPFSQIKALQKEITNCRIYHDHFLEEI